MQVYGDGIISRPSSVHLIIVDGHISGVSSRRDSTVFLTDIHCPCIASTKVRDM